MGEWVRAIRKYDNQTHTRNVEQYILDNEPMLWNSTHRDVHPSATTYERAAQKDHRLRHRGPQGRPPGRHSGARAVGLASVFLLGARTPKWASLPNPTAACTAIRPFLDWWLMKLRDHAQRTGQRILDVVDVHFYPQADGTYGHGEKTDPCRRRLAHPRHARTVGSQPTRTSRGSPTKSSLIPRLKEIIADNYPGLKVSIGEYNFGGERHISGALAQAEALGRFGQQGVVVRLLLDLSARQQRRVSRLPRLSQLRRPGRPLLGQRRRRHLRRQDVAVRLQRRHRRQLWCS